jgi:hypothetical protein
MAMTPAATVAQSIVSGINVPESGQADALAAWTTIVTQLQAMIVAGTVTVPSLGLIAPPGAAGGPVTGAAVGTIS